MNIKEAKYAGERLAEIFKREVSGAFLQKLTTQPFSLFDADSQNLARQVMLATKKRSLNLLLRCALVHAFERKLRREGVANREIVTYGSLLRECLAASAVFKDRTDEAPTPEASGALIKAKFTELRGLIEAGRIEGAAQFLTDCIRDYPDNSAFATNLGIVLLQLGRSAEGQAQLQRAIALKPAFAAPYFNLASFLFWKGEIHEAKDLALKAIELEPKNLKALSLLGSICIAQGDTEEGNVYLERAFVIDPRSPSVLISLASVNLLKGDKPRAREYFETASVLDPRAVDALVGLASLETDEEERARIAERMQKLLSSSLPISERISLLYALGDYHDKNKEPAEAFAAYKRANDLKLSQVTPYSPAAYSEQVSKTIRLYSKEALATVSKTASLSYKPVFVVGMMRSGTSLTEQILASHPKCFGAGELDFWLDIFKQKPEWILEELPEDAAIQAIASRFTRFMDSRASEAERFVDKTTFNLMYLGLIHKVFPNAKIICMRRNPIDTCLSCYFKNFINGASFAMDLDSLAHFYREHLRLIEHWRAALPQENFMELSYEGLIEDQEASSRRLIEFVGLPWDERVLKFHKTERVVRTASTLQVREKLYSSAIGRWRPYREFISPLLALEQSSSAEVTG